MERFLGNIDAKADAKGRVFVPAAFRKNLQTTGSSRWIMRKDIFQDCLVFYPEEIWNQELDALRAKLSRWDKKQQNIFRKFVMDAETLEMDSNGRVLISKRYMQLAGITSEIRFIGMDYTVEVWAKEKIENFSMSSEDFESGIEEYMSSL